ncbi:MAG TPA: hypothetical protein VNW71_14445, partial [Thermoanaerobaculia bacterium]|nr:hypothetical protein [Thermoanaerobaculia bacterium]
MIPEALAALAGGRAPRAWQRGMARAAAPLGALRRSAAWLAGLARVRLGLREEPLLGSCFTELALRPFPSGEPKEAAARPAPSRSRLQEPPSRLTRSSAEPGSPRERRQAPPVPRTEERRPREQEEGRGVRDARAAREPLLLEGRAGRELLERLAENSRLPAQSQPSPSPGGGARRPRFLPEAFSPSRRGMAEGRGGRWERGTEG